jgi:U4/U6.U5 tri-snRNP-associated protein 1
LPKLEYIDDNGKAMSTKEAFRYMLVFFFKCHYCIMTYFVTKFLKLVAFSRHLSHKFHGKGSGKLKSEKRAKKDEDKMVPYFI